MLQAIDLKVTKSARFFVWGNPDANIEQVWFVCHGYGQLASYFIKKFEILDPQKHLVVAPEGLSKFYLDGLTGRVGATWMTKENRLHEIGDYVAYLNTVYERVHEEFNLKPLKTNILGFSQGVATVCRWITMGNPQFDTLIAWAGNFPHDWDYVQAQELLEQKKVFFVVGDKDEFLQPQTLQAHLDFLKPKGIVPQVIPFAGKHELYPEVIQQLATRITQG